MTLASATGPALARDHTGRFVCRRLPKAAEFFVPADPVRQTAILHRSTKALGRWQVSYFEAGAPGMDGTFATCTTAVRMLPLEYQLRQVIE
jgi:hypothetical protein